MKPHPNPPGCYGGILICAWPAAVIIGIMVQCFITAWGVDHHKRLLRQRHHQLARLQTNGRPKETKEEARQRKFRYLYQVRTARGDIIAQVSNEQLIA